MSDSSLANKLLSDLVVYRTYAKYLPEKSRREILNEAIDRNMQMHIDKFPHLTDKIVETFNLVRRGSILPSMRCLQFGGSGVLRNNIRLYNCSFHNIDRVSAFPETLYLLLCGTGVGYSVQSKHVVQLPKIHKPLESMYYPIHDSIEGWAMALDALMRAYFLRQPLPQFDYFQIREEGSLLKTTGGRAPGPVKLKSMLEQVKAKLDTMIGRCGKPIEIHDIICMISDCVRSGGIREAALIALFDRDDLEMLKCKSGNWWEEHPYRARANNSAVLPRGLIAYDEFVHIFDTSKNSQAGEPGFYWTNDSFEWGCNPCVELSLRNRQFCNLTTMNQATVTSFEDLIIRARAAAFLGTIQASYTDFPYLDDRWRRVTEEEALIGVSFTGIADAGNRITSSMLQAAALAAVDENTTTAKLIGINKAARVTTVKPEGSSSATLGTSSGIHARRGSKDRTYLRRVRLKNDTPLTRFLVDNVPGLMEESLRDDNMIICIPQLAPEGAIMEHSDTGLGTFNRAMLYNKEWVAPGHVSGANRNNVSCTTHVRDSEWDVLMNSMWDNKDLYNGMSILPYNGGTYVQAPFEECDKATYDKYLGMVRQLDFTQIVEYDDSTNQQAQPACAGGACEIT